MAYENVKQLKIESLIYRMSEKEEIKEGSQGDEDPDYDTSSSEEEKVEESHKEEEEKVEKQPKPLALPSLQAEARPDVNDVEPDLILPFFRFY